MQFRPKKIDYTTPAGAAGGPGISQQISWYVNTPYINMSTSVYTGVQQAIGASLGDVWWLGGGPAASGGNAFMFVRARAALAVGQLVTLQAPTAGTLTIPGSPVSTSAAITTNISNATAGTNGEVDNYIYVNPAAGYTTTQLRRIKANTNAATGNFTVALQDFLRPNSPTDQDVFDGFSAFANADAVCVIRPYNVIVNTATTVPCGVALGTVTSGNYTIIQVAGLAGVNSTTATANVPAVGGAAGVITTAAGVGNGTGGAAAASLYGSGTMILPMITNAVAANIIPCMVNFTGV
jgi:hypothetical protein